VPGREGDDEIAMDHSRDVRGQDQAAVRLAREGLDGALDVGSVLDRAGHNLDCERRSQSLCRSEEVIKRRGFGIGHKRRG
jgi:hypothetical protein